MRDLSKSVVIGGRGFLGRHLVAGLVGQAREPHRLAVVSRSGTEGPGRTIRGDRRQERVLRTAFEGEPETLFDLALFDAEEARTLVAAWRGSRSRPRLVVAGTVAEYGLSRPLPRPVPEDLVGEPESDYGRNKQAAWQVLDEARRTEGLELIWAVLPQLWGPGDLHGRDSSWVRDIRDGRPIILRGNGRTLMPDGYVGTVAEALLHLAARPTVDAARLQVAGPMPLTPLAFLRWSASALGRPLHVLHVAPRTMFLAEVATETVFRAPFGDYDLVLGGERLAATGFVPSRLAREGVVETALSHDRQRPPDMASLVFSPPFHKLVERKGTEVTHVV